MDPLRPYDIFNVGIVGAVRGLIVPYSDEDVPLNISDVVGLEYPYPALGEWLNCGASVNSKVYTRGFETEGIDIQEETGSLFEDVTETTRSFTLPFAEVTPTFEQIIENAPPAFTNDDGHDVVALTSITDLKNYRAVLIGVRKKDSGVVVEDDGRERGRLIARFLNRVTLAADDVDEEYEKGTLAEAAVQFNAFPDPDVVDPETGDWGRVIMEPAGPVSGS